MFVSRLFLSPFPPPPPERKEAATASSSSLVTRGIQFLIYAFPHSRFFFIPLSFTLFGKDVFTGGRGKSVGAQPPTWHAEWNGSSVGIRAHCIDIFARLAPICKLSRCLLTKFLHQSSVESLLRVCCWLGRPLSFELECLPGGIALKAEEEDINTTPAPTPYPKKEGYRQPHVCNIGWVTLPLLTMKLGRRHKSTKECHFAIIVCYSACL